MITFLLGLVAGAWVVCVVVVWCLRPKRQRPLTTFERVQQAMGKDLR